MGNLHLSLPPNQHQSADQLIKPVFKFMSTADKRNLVLPPFVNNNNNKSASCNSLFDKVNKENKEDVAYGEITQQKEGQGETRAHVHGNMDTLVAAGALKNVWNNATRCKVGLVKNSTTIFYLMAILIKSYILKFPFFGGGSCDI